MGETREGASQGAELEAVGTGEVKGVEAAGGGGGGEGGEPAVDGVAAGAVHLEEADGAHVEAEGLGDTEIGDAGEIEIGDAPPEVAPGAGEDGGAAGVFGGKAGQDVEDDALGEVAQANRRW